MDDESVGDVERTDDVRKAYEQELKKLRQGIGCTPERLWASDCVGAALRSRLQEAGKLVTPQALVDELESMVRSLGNPADREPLLAAFGFNEQFAGSILEGRRKKYNESLRASDSAETKRLYADIRTQERRENSAIEALGKFLANPNVLKRRSPVQFGSDEPRQHVLEYRDYDIFFSDTGAILRQDISMYARALVQNAEPMIEVTAKYFNDSKPGTISIEPRSGCEVMEQSESQSGAFAAKLKIYEVLSPDDGLYPLSYRLSVTSRARSQPIVYWQVFTGPVRRIVFRLNFHQKMRPARAWWFSSYNEFLAEIEPDRTEGRHLEILNSGRYVYKVFGEGERPLPCLYYGIAWIWIEE